MIFLFAQGADLQMAFSWLLPSVQNARRLCCPKFITFPKTVWPLAPTAWGLAIGAESLTAYWSEEEILKAIDEDGIIRT